MPHPGCSMTFKMQWLIQNLSILQISQTYQVYEENSFVLVQYTISWQLLSISLLTVQLSKSCGGEDGCFQVTESTFTPRLTWFSRHSSPMIMHSRMFTSVSPLLFKKLKSNACELEFGFFSFGSQRCIFALGKHREGWGNKIFVWNLILYNAALFFLTVLSWQLLSLLCCHLWSIFPPAMD